MALPDLELIYQVMLLTEGFKDFYKIAKLTAIISKHFKEDFKGTFTLRMQKSVFQYMGKKLRHSDNTKSEMEIFGDALRVALLS